MQIIVGTHKIETKEIASIQDAGFRTHGFIINIIGGKSIHFTIKEDYDSSPNQIRDIDRRYERLRNEVQNKWDEDKTDITIFTL